MSTTTADFDITCPWCQQSIECPGELHDTLVTCPACAKELLARPPASIAPPVALNSPPVIRRPIPVPWYPKRPWLTLAILGVVALAVFMILGILKQPTHAATGPDSQEAYEVAENFCRQSLLSPSTAKFSADGEKVFGHTVQSGKTFASKRKDGLWEAQGYVDSQNAFGAMIRQDWLAVVQPIGGKWKLIYLQIGTEKTGQYPGP